MSIQNHLRLRNDMPIHPNSMLTGSIIKPQRLRRTYKPEQLTLRNIERQEMIIGRSDASSPDKQKQKSDMTFLRTVREQRIRKGLNSSLGFRAKNHSRGGFRLAPPANNQNAPKDPQNKKSSLGFAYATLRLQSFRIKSRTQKKDKTFHTIGEQSQGRNLVSPGVVGSQISSRSPMNKKIQPFL